MALKIILVLNNTMCVVYISEFGNTVCIVGGFQLYSVLLKAFQHKHVLYNGCV